MPNTRTVRIGVHARNDYKFTEQDYELVREAKIETIKIMSFTEDRVFERLRKENPELQFIVRLYKKMGVGVHPSPQEFASEFVPRMKELRLFTTKFEVHNEPNHPHRYEGWGQEDSYAHDFNQWFLQVYSLLKSACEWAELGFPGLAVPHRDLEWLDICRPAIEKADWLGAHCYWQTPPEQPNNHLVDKWGLRFKDYHSQFPTKTLEITEFGNSNGQSGLPLSEKERSRQYVEYYQELFKYPYIGSASAFIASSPDESWEREGFVWIKRDGTKLPVIAAVGDIPRPRLVPVVVLPTYGVKYVSHAVPRSVQAGQRGRATITLQNSGLKTWQAKGKNMVRLGYHWFTPDGQPVAVAEDIRTALPTNVATEQKVKLEQVEFSAPLTEGQYVLQWDLVEEGITWFSNAGANPLQTEIKVEPAPPPTEMYFEMTDKTVGSPFLEFFQRYGLDICGYPITEAVPESGLLSQYFQRIALEEHEPGKVRLKLVGAEVLTSRTVIEELEEQVEGWNDKVERLQESLKVLEEELETLVHKPPSPSSSTVTPPTTSRPKVEDITDSLLKHPTNRYETRSLDTIKYLVIHHSGAPASVGPERIASYQVEKQDWPGIGYHFVLTADGTIYQTNALETICYHAQEVSNTGVGLCLTGNFTDELPTAAQLDSVGHLCAYLLQELKLPNDSIKGHKDFVATQCPGRQWDSDQVWRDLFFQRLETHQTPVRTRAAPRSRVKTIGHYVLFWQDPTSWAQHDWQNATTYIGRFRPTCGFSVDDALTAEFVTIIGHSLPSEVEQQLKNAGCKVERIAGQTAADTKRILDAMAQKGQRFLTFEL